MLNSVILSLASTKKFRKIISYQTSVSSCIEYSHTSGFDFRSYTETRLIGSVSTLKRLLEKVWFLGAENSVLDLADSCIETEVSVFT